MMRSRSVFEIDLYIASATVALVTIGILFIFSSGVTASGQVVSNEYVRQILWAASGFVLLIVMTFIDYRDLRRPALRRVCRRHGVLLVLTLAVGRVVNGARSWIGIGPLGVQPAEFAKLALILVLAQFYAENQNRARSLAGFLGGLGITAIPTALVLLQPDLGTAIVFFPIFLFIAFAGGAKIRHLLFFAGTGFLVVLFTVLPVWDEHLSAQPIAFIGAIARSARDSTVDSGSGDCDSQLPVLDFG